MVQRSVLESIATDASKEAGRDSRVGERVQNDARFLLAEEVRLTRGLLRGLHAQADAKKV